MALRVLMDNLVVRHGGMPYRIPVHHSDTAIYPSLLVEIHESIYYGLVKFRLHSEAGSVPVARSAELAKLLEDNSTVFLFPLPGVL